MGRLKDLDLEHVWHPFTQMNEFEPEENLIIVRGQGNYLYDEDGNRYFDATSSLWVNVHGHSQPALNAAVRRQLGRIAHSTLLGTGNEPAALLAEKLVSISPDGLTKVFYSDNGSTAVEVALKMAFQYYRHLGATGKQRSKFVSLSNGYHGDTLGSVSVGGMELFHSIFSPLLFRTYTVPSPYCYRCPFSRSRPACGLECVEAMERLLAEKGEEIAAVLVEPLVQGAGGMVAYPVEVLQGYFECARRHNVLFVVDEVATGIGRTGEMFACDHAGISPDMMAVAKGLTGGYLPVAATLVKQRIFDAFLGSYAQFKTFFHGHTYTGNQLGCASALANLDLVTDARFLPRVRESARHLEEKLDELASSPFVGDIRLVGMMGGIELVRGRKKGESFAVDARTGHHVCLKAREAGVLARPLGDVLVLMPPLSSTREELNHLVEALKYGIDAVLGTCRMPLPRLRDGAGSAAGVLDEAACCPRVSRPRKLLVTGTDTGVGKTVVTMGLAAALARRTRVCCYKPVESGVSLSTVEPASDAALLSHVSNAALDLPEFAFPDPLSPNVAGRLVNSQVDFEAIVHALRSLPEESPVVLVEGAGGLMVPITDSLSFGDLAREAELPVLVVAADKLGCLNHTLLTVRTVNDLGLPLVGVVLNCVDSGTDDPSRNHNEHELRRLLGNLFLGTVSYLPDRSDREVLADSCARLAEQIWP